MKMTPFDAYRTYLGIKRYFLSEDMQGFFPSKNVKYETFIQRNDAKMFHALCNKYQKDEDIVNLYVSNMLIYTDCWIGDLLSPECEANYTEWKRRSESLDYLFAADCTTIAAFLSKNKLSFDDLFKPAASGIPYISKMVARKTIIPETYAILDIILDFSEPLNKYYSNNIIWKTLTLRYNKYKAFLSLTNEQMKKYEMALLSKLAEYNIHT